MPGALPYLPKAIVEECPDGPERSKTWRASIRTSAAE
jgi:hypothetical protein